MRYSPKFYKDLMEGDSSSPYTYDPKFLKFAHWNGFAVGAVCARMEPLEHDPESSKLYIMTINVLAAYRRRGIASTLLKYVLETAGKDKTIKEISLHVQTSNDEAKAFYVHHGFQDMGIVEGYYKRIEPDSAFYLRKDNTYVGEDCPDACEEGCC